MHASLSYQCNYCKNDSKHYTGDEFRSHLATHDKKIKLYNPTYYTYTLV